MSNKFKLAVYAFTGMGLVFIILAIISVFYSAIDPHSSNMQLTYPYQSLSIPLSIVGLVFLSIGPFRKTWAKLAANLISLILPKVATERFFDFWEKKGYHITPIHFYEPIPDTRTLKNELWSSKSELVGIDMRQQEQLELLSQTFSKYKNEFNYPANKTAIPHEYYLENNFFPSIDAEVLHAMIRHFKPKRIIEVGSGFSTYLASKACLLNTGENGLKVEYCIIDPFPNDTIKKGVPGVSTLIQKPVEQVGMDLFLQLDENDILFIDSSHVIRIGGDVNYEFLEIIPRMKKGVIIHIHDIFLPYEYPKDFIFENHRFWSEQYLLQAFLAFNCSFEVLWAGYFMHQNFPAECRAVFPSYNKGKGPGSFWIRKKK